MAELTPAIDDGNPLSNVPATFASDPGHVNLGAQQVIEANEAAEEGFLPSPVEAATEFADSVQRQFRSGGNYAYQVFADIDRIRDSGDEDPSWQYNVDEWLDKQSDIPEAQKWRYKLTRNASEAEALKADQKLWAEDQRILAERNGFSTFAAGAIAGIVDIDAPVAFATGGLTAAAKGGIMATRAARLAMGAAAGGLTATGAAAVGYEVDPNADWSSVPTMGLMGMVFGGAGAMMASRNRTANEFGETVAEGSPRQKENLHKETFTNNDPWHSERTVREEALAEDEAAAAPKAEGAEPEPVIETIDPQGGKADYEPDPNDPYFSQGGSSVGARQMTPSGPGIASIKNQRILDIITDSQQFVNKLGLATDWHDRMEVLRTKGGPIGRAAARFGEMIQATALGADSDRLMQSGSAVYQRLAYMLFENPSGVYVNNRSAARVQEHYYKQLMARFAPFEDSFNNWATDIKKAGTFRRMADENLRGDFNQQVVEELMARKYGGQRTASSHVKSAADAVDEAFKKEVEITKGRPGETSVKGADTLTEASGYMPQKWLGRNIKNLMATSNRSKDDIVQAVAEAYVHQHPRMKMADATKYADAAVNRALRIDTGTNANLIGILQADGRSELEDFLLRQGHQWSEINRLIDNLTGTMEQSGIPGHLKGRLDIDLRFTASNGIRVMDLMDTDFQSMVARRMRRSSGQGALARAGIPSRADWQAIVDAGKQEQAARGKSQATGTSVGDRVNDLIDADTQLNDEFLDGLYSYFNGAPIAGGISPMYARMKKLTNLALLNQLGLTQLAELGPTIAAVGWESFLKHAGEALQVSLKNKESPLIKELRHMDILIPEDRLFRDDLVFEFEKETTQHEYMRQFDRVLNKAQRIQGFTSGFYAMRNIQQRIAVTASADRLARHFKNGGLVSDERLKDMGFNQANIGRFKHYINNNTVEFDPDTGYLKKLNLDKWDPEDADDFARILNQRANTLVQKALAGESSMIFHKDGLAQLFFHLKSFPMLAMQKQALRHARIMDDQAMLTFMYGLGTAAAAYTARQVINGREDRLGAVDVAKGAFQLSNMTGWIPMWTDPLAGMLGMNSLQFGGYGIGNQVISTPAALPTINRLAGIPGALLSLGDLSLDYNDINSLSAFPLFGNAAGFAYMFNALKDDAKTEKAREARAAQKARQEATKVRQAPIAKQPNAELLDKISRAGYADPQKYLDNNTDAGMSLKDIEAAINTELGL